MEAYQKTAITLSVLKIHFSRFAETDLFGLANNIVSKFGIEQARNYRDQFLGVFPFFAGQPGIWQKCKESRYRIAA